MGKLRHRECVKVKQGKVDAAVSVFQTGNEGPEKREAMYSRSPCSEVAEAGFEPRSQLWAKLP